MAGLRLSHIYKVYENASNNKKEKAKPAVSDFCMEIQDKEFIVFVGPSGCGKSTTLRMIAGLEDISAGELYIGDRLVNDIEPKDRDIAMVFQNYALYPHMTVFDNMAFALKLRKFPYEVEYTDKEGNKKTKTVMKHMPKAEIKEKVLAAAKILDIDEYLERKPKALSGGQRQRVALGRAIVRNPKVFLLDEPLSNLDAKLRATMRTEITKLHKKLETTFIYVTHDQVEAMTMGTRIVVMKSGFVQQIGAPQYLYDHPVNKFVAGFIGTPQMSFFPATISNGVVTFGFGESIELTQETKDRLIPIEDGKKVWVGVRSEDIRLSDDNDAFECMITVLEELGSETILYGTFDVNEAESVVSNGSDSNFVAKLPGKTKLYGNEKTKIKFDVNRLHIFDYDSETTLFKDGQEDIVAHETIEDDQCEDVENVEKKKFIDKLAFWKKK